MKKSLFGYNVSEVNVMINALREENESLNATITTLKTQMKNGLNGNGAKFTLLETDLKRNEEELKRVSQERDAFMIKISSLTKELEELRLQNAELIAHPIPLHINNIGITELAAGKEPEAIAIPSQKNIEELQTSKEELSAVREERNDELRRNRRELESLSAALNSKNEELIKTKSELSLTKDSLVATKAALDTAIDQLEKFQKEKKPINVNKASEISYQAYYEMSRMRSEIVEYMHQLTKEYYQLLNDNNLKIRSALECRQQEYNQMVREFFTETSEFRNKLSSIEVECGNVVDFNMNIEQVSMRMKEIMDQFMKDCDTSIRNI